MSETNKDLEFSTLTIIGAGTGMLILGATFLICFQMFAHNYIGAVDSVGLASRASRVTTTWPEGIRQHAVQTTRQEGQSVHDWGIVHLQEANGMMVEMEPR